MEFRSFNLHASVAAGVENAGYLTPTPIQEQAIPAALAGRDILGLAQTGTGKTAAFVLPMLNRLRSGPRGIVRALVVAPTRELAEQIHEDIKMLGSGTSLRSATVYGGVGMAPQVRALRGNAEIIVACPGRLLDHLERGNAELSKLEILVLDEADHMFDMGFLPDIRRIMKRVPDGAQRMLFSATMPADIRRLADAILSDPVTVEIDHNAPTKTVRHTILPVAKKQKTELLTFLLRRDDPRSALVFTRTKYGAKRLARQLDRAGFFVSSLQGNLSQNQRQKALDGFRDGRFHVLVATDIAARGIDVTRVSHVINYDVPSTADAYTHRIGRTGRAERSGEAFTFMTEEDEKVVRAIERALAMHLRRVTLDGFAYREMPQVTRPEPARPANGQRRGNSRRRGRRSRGSRERR